MQQDINDLKVLFPPVFDIENIKHKVVMQPFCDEAVDFFNALSRELNKDVRVRNYPDVATFAFFCRKANILNLKKQYDISRNGIRLGRGIVFHVAPSNVPVNFAYSLLCGILAGNKNIVRVPSKNFEQVVLITEAILRVTETGQYDEITGGIVLVQYDRQSTATSFFSSVCDVRVIWGGDETISGIRRNPILPRAFDVTFADRYSLCVIDAKKYLEEGNAEAIALGFYNDTYLFDQNACTAPHLIAWLGDGEEVETAKERFWNVLYKLVKQKYKEIQPVIAVDKLTALYKQAVSVPDIYKEESADNLLWRVHIDVLPDNIDEYRCTSGYFSECNIRSLSDLVFVINNKYQTLAYYGFSVSELSDFVRNNHLLGIDRIVPIGHTMDFSLTWDGYDLIETLSRCCEVK